MRASISMEYIIIVIALIFIYAALFVHYIALGSSSVHDVEKMIKVKGELLKLRTAGQFVRSSDYGIVTLTLVLPADVNLHIGSTLDANVPVVGNYNLCDGNICHIGVSSPFTSSANLSGTVQVRIEGNTQSVWVVP